MTTSSAPSRKASLILSGVWVKTTTCAPIALASFTPMWPSPPSPTMPTSAFDDLVVSQRGISGDAGAKERSGGGEIQILRDVQHKGFITTKLPEYPP